MSKRNLDVATEIDIMVLACWATPCLWCFSIIVVILAAVTGDK